MFSRMFSDPDCTSSPPLFKTERGGVYLLIKLNALRD
jgi:hypothetical protein